MSEIDVSQTNIKKEGIALIIKPIKDPKSGLGVVFDSALSKKESPTVIIDSVREQKDG